MTTPSNTRAVALVYHTVADRPLPHVSPLYACKSPTDLERDLAYISECLSPVGHDDLVEARERGKPLPPRAIAVTFDDGFAGCFDIVRPLLLKYRIPATFFVIRDMVDNRALMHRNKLALCLSRLDDAAADLAAAARACGCPAVTPDALRTHLRRLPLNERAAVDRLCDALDIDVEAYLRDARPYMSSEQIRTLHAEGFAIGAHSVDHSDLTRLPWEAARAQIVQSCDYVRGLTGRARVPFAFPFNGLGLDRQRLAELRAEAGTVDLMYDTNDLMRDAPFVVNRIWCDAPPRGAKRSTLPGVLLRARALEPLRVARRWLH